MTISQIRLDKNVLSMLLRCWLNVRVQIMDQPVSRMFLRKARESDGVYTPEDTAVLSADAGKLLKMILES